MASSALPTPSEVLPSNLTKVSIQSTAFPDVYLRSDADKPAASGDNRLLNLQVGRAGWERHELVPQPVEEYGPDVFIIRSVKFADHFVHLDPTLFPEQTPKPGTTFHPKGIGRGSVVGSIDAASRFKIVVNDPDLQGGEYTISFKLVYTPPAGAPKNYYLRLNGNDVDGFKGPGSGEVNGQTYIGPFERLLVERFA